MAWIALFMGALVLIGLIQLNVSYWRELKRMTPDEYQRFKMGQGDIHTGTHLKDWPAMTPSLIKLLNYLNIWTVEHLSQCSDKAMQDIGMGAREWVNKAKAYLDLAKDTSAITRYAAENEVLTTKLAVLEEQMKKVLADEPREPKRKGGRPRKVHLTPPAPAA